jgi:hypothetical protein
VRTSKYAKNKQVLAARIGISRPALVRLFERGDYPPITNHGWDVAQWQRYADHNIATWNRRSKRNGSNGSNVNERDQALLKKKQIEIERETFKLDVERGKYELKTVVREQVLTHVNTLFRELDKAFKHELPPRVEGLSAGDVAKLCGRRLDDLRARLVKSFEGTNGS